MAASPEPGAADRPAVVSLKPVGWVRTDAGDNRVREEWQTLESRIELLPEVEPGLAGIDGFSHLLVLCYLHRLPEESGVLQIRPRGLLRYGLTWEELPLIGVFACDSPRRPNPIGLSIVRLVRRDGRVLWVQGLDAFDGTPVLDIKPYTADRAIANPRFPEWHDALLRKSRAPRV